MSESNFEIFSKLQKAINRKLHTSTGRNIGTYLMCVVAAFVFWTFITLDEEVERDYKIPLKIANIPDSVVVIGNTPSSINAVIKGRGRQFLKYSLNRVPEMLLDFRQYSLENSILLSRGKLDSKLRDIFGQNIDILVVNPDSIKIEYTSKQGKKLPLVINYDITPGLQSIISGQIKATIDSVIAYSINEIPANIQSIETEVLTLHNVSDTTICEVAIKQPLGIRVVPDKVNVIVPAELLIAKKRNIPITITNVPNNIKLITFPSNVELEYMVPMRLFNKDFTATASVDFKKIGNNSRHAKVDMSDLPYGYRIISLTPDSVEYYIENK